jgi:hypothetical protein
MLRRTLTCLALTLCFPPIVAAQAPAGGSLVRWKQDGFRIEGRVIEALPDGTGLRVFPTGGPALREVPRREWSAPRDLGWDTPNLEQQVRAGRRGRGALYGLGIGAGVGIVAGLASGDDDGWFALTAEAKAAGLAVLLAPVGAILGALTAPGAVWQPVTTTRVSASRVGVHLGASGVGMKVRF